MKLTPVVISMALAVCAMPSFAQVGVSVNIGQPGFYGQIDIGDFPQPRVVYERPVTVYTEVEDERPIYLHVPPGYEKHWAKHCGVYRACGRRVYFVRDDWYNDEYVPRYSEKHPEYRKHHSEKGERDYGDGRSDKQERHEEKEERHEWKEDRHERKHGKDHDNGRHDD